jgi:hypothetical protein
LEIVQAGDVAVDPEDVEGLDQSIDDREGINDAGWSCFVGMVGVEQLAVALGRVVRMSFRGPGNLQEVQEQVEVKGRQGDVLGVLLDPVVEFMLPGGKG